MSRVESVGGFRRTRSSTSATAREQSLITAALGKRLRRAVMGKNCMLGSLEGEEYN